MDCFGNSGNYSDYRNGMMNGGGANAVSYNSHHHHPYANYHHPSNMRYPHMANYRNSNDASNAMPYDRYSGYGAANHAYGSSNAGYNSMGYGYTPNSGSTASIDSRSNPFHAQHQHAAYDPYNPMPAPSNYASSSSHSQYAYHQRDFHSFESGAPYRTRGAGVNGSNYMMRDPYQHPYVGTNQTHCGDYMPMPPNVGNGIGNTSPSSAILSPGIKTGPQHHHPHSYQPMHGPSFGDFYKNMPMANNQYVTDPNAFSPHSMTGGHPFMARDEKSRKSHRDRSLSKLVAMNRRLESQVSMMNECERLGTPFTENYEYYTDYSATPDSTISTNYNNVDQLNSNMEISTPRDTNGTDAPIEPKSTDETIVCAKEADTKLLENPVENPNAATATSNSSQSPAKEKPTKKSNNKTGDSSTIKKRRKRKDLKRNDELDKKDEIKVDLIPLPGFQQAFGSTEIGRFSEIFFNFAESPVEPGVFESETDLSPLPWEMGDSLEGPHFNLQPNIAGLTPAYAESYGSTDSPTASNNSYFGDVCTPEYP